MEEGDNQEVIIKKPLRYEKQPKKKGDNIFKDTFPPILIPTKRTETYFEVIIAIAILISVIELLSGNIMSGGLESDIDIGYPLPMISMSFQGENDSIFKFGNLVLDFLIYLGIAYMIDILVGLMFQKNTKKKDNHTLETLKPIKHFTKKDTNKDKTNIPNNTTPATEDISTQNTVQPKI
ncbi:hypothetical protein HN747_00060 [archaeon]|jgi:hypothetical protein|nr:hypothetical protein [archaeon]